MENYRYSLLVQLLKVLVIFFFLINSLNANNVFFISPSSYFTPNYKIKYDALHSKAGVQIGEFLPLRKGVKNAIPIVILCGFNVIQGDVEFNRETIDFISAEEDEILREELIEDLRKINYPASFGYRLARHTGVPVYIIYQPTVSDSEKLKDIKTLYSDYSDELMINAANEIGGENYYLISISISTIAAVKMLKDKINNLIGITLAAPFTNFKEVFVDKKTNKMSKFKGFSIVAVMNVINEIIQKLIEPLARIFLEAFFNGLVTVNILNVPEHHTRDLNFLNLRSLEYLFSFDLKKEVQNKSLLDIPKQFLVPEYDEFFSSKTIEPIAKIMKALFIVMPRTTHNIADRKNVDPGLFVINKHYLRSKAMFQKAA